MQKLILMILAFIGLMACVPNTFDPEPELVYPQPLPDKANKIHKIYLASPELDLRGVEVWGVEFELVSSEDEAHVTIELVTDIGDTMLQRYGVMLNTNFAGMYRYTGEYPDRIFVSCISTALLAHEFGHYLGLGHNDKVKSILYPIVSVISMVSFYSEFITGETIPIYSNNTNYINSR